MNEKEPNTHVSDAPLAKLGKKKIKGLLSNIHNFITTKTLSSQIVFIFIFFQIIFVTILIVYRKNQAFDFLDGTTTRHYLKNFTQLIFVPQFNMKAMMDSNNNFLNVQEISRNLMFMNLISQELYQHNLGYINENTKESDIAFSPKLTAQNLIKGGYTYSDLNKEGKQELNFTVENIGERLIKSEKGDFINTNYFVPLHWSFTPIFHQLYNFLGISSETSYFTAYKLTSNQDPQAKSFDCNYKNSKGSEYGSYFKFPVINNEKFAGSRYDSNSRVYDYILEPLSSCFDYKLETKMLKKKIEENWFRYFDYKVRYGLNNKTAMTKTYKLIKLDQLRNRRILFMTASSFIIPFGKDSSYVFSFIQQTQAEKTYLPYLNLKKKNNHDFSSYASTFTLFSDSLDPWDYYIPYNISNNVYLKDYNIDDHYNFVYNIPEFLLTMYDNSVRGKDIEQSEETFTYKEIMTNSFGERIELFQDTEMFDQYFLERYTGNSAKGFSYSYPFVYDLNFFQFVNFMSYYQRDGFCRIRDLDFYYTYINQFFKEFPNLDCLNDLCKIIDCSNIPQLIKYKYSPYTFTETFPSCYCLPLYCYDDYNMTDYFDAVGFMKYNQAFEPFLPYIKNITKLPNECKIDFLMKNNDTVPMKMYINSDVKFYDFKNGASLFSMTLERYDINDLLATYVTEKVEALKFILFMAYNSTVTILIFVFWRILKKKLLHLSTRIDKFQNFYATVITHSLNNLIVDNPRMNIETTIFEQSKTNQQDPDDKDNLLVQAKGEVEQSKEMKERSVVIHDELNELKHLLVTNLDIFKVDFILDRKIYDDNKIIETLKKELIQDYYSKAMFAKKQNDSIDESMSKSSSQEEGGSIVSESYVLNSINFHLLYELMSTEMIDFDNYKPNFYFKDKKENRLLDFYQPIENLLLNDEISLNEITDAERLSKSLKFFLNEIHQKWLNKYYARCSKVEREIETEPLISTLN